MTIRRPNSAGRLYDVIELLKFIPSQKNERLSRFSIRVAQYALETVLADLNEHTLEKVAAQIERGVTRRGSR